MNHSRWRGDIIRRETDSLGGETDTVKWEADALRRCVVGGGSGAIGGMFTELLSRSGIAVCVVDGKPPAQLGGVRFAVGDIASPSANVITELAKADLILLAVPEPVALAALPSLTRAAAPGALLAHTLSVQSRMAAALAEKAAGFQAVGLNPMFAPSLGIAGRPVAAAVVQDGPKVAELLLLVSAWGGQVVRVDADKHDRFAAASQALTHAAVLAFGFALAELDADIAELSAIAPPPSVTMLALLARVVSGTPEVYWDVQAANPYARRARAALCAGAQKTAELAASSTAEFEESLDQLKQLLKDQRRIYLRRCAEIFSDPLRPAAGNVGNSASRSSGRPHCSGWRHESD